MRVSRLIPAALALAACGRGEKEEPAVADTAHGATAVAVATAPAADPAASALVRATAPMRDANGRDLGTLALVDASNGITVSGVLRGLPAGAHGIHLHMVGRCEPPFESAGGHWNPMQKQHGTSNPQGPHFGDMPNITVAGDSVDVQVTSAGGTLRGTGGGPALLDDDGAAVVVHAKGDDYRTDPSGSSGARVACGVVTLETKP